MQVSKLTLSGFLRLMHNNIRHFELTPDSVYQLILGTNGSGKSSVLHELSPLPASREHYARDGYKEIHIEHKGASYQLLSVFKSNNKHSFIKDGEELNPGGTAAVQKDLVAQYFNITPEIHALLTGTALFTQFTPAKRREWITSLATVDYTYALSVHKSLKSATRDAQGALKHNQKRLTDETNKLLGVGDLDQIEQRYNKLHKELNQLFTEKDPRAGRVDELEREIKSLLTELGELATVLIEKRPDHALLKEFDSLEAIDEGITKAKTDSEVNRSLRAQIGSEQEELQKLVSSFEQAGVEDLSTVSAQRTELVSKREQTQAKIEEWTELSGEADTLQRDFYDINVLLVQTINNLPENGDRRFTADNLKKAREEHPGVKHQYERRCNQLSQRQRQLEHLESLKEQQCPECGYRWVPGKSESEAEQLQNQIAELDKACQALEAQVNRIQNYIDQADEYKQAFGAFKRLTQDYPRLHELWTALLNDERLMSDPRQLVPLIQSLGRDLEHYVALQGFDRRIEKLDQLLESNQDGSRLDGLKQRLDALDTKMSNVTQTLSESSERITALEKLKQHFTAYYKRWEWLQDKLVALERTRDALLEAYRGEAIDGAIRTHQNELASLQGQRTQKQTLEGIIEDLQRDQSELKDRHEIVAALTRELSPTEGLIAEQLKGFIASFVGHVNEVIEQIWSYDMQVLPCGVDSSDLDYKFPLHISHEGTETITKDIAEGSEAQVEVTNLAFRLVMMVYLGLEDYPVYLDEAGRSFDEQHRLNLLNFVKQLVDTGNYTQLFIVSHYMASFNIYHNAEVLVLDEANITVPKDYNTHAVLE